MGSSRADNRRTVLAGTICGFLGGALLVGLVLWYSGHVIAPRAEGLRTATATAPRDPIAGGLADADPAPVRRRKPDSPRPVPTSGSLPAEAVTKEPPPELKDRDLEVPVEGVRPEALVRSFADARSGNRVHEALDILAARNTPVRAVEGGRIVKLFNSKAGGITVYQFDPSERFCYYYAHLERYADGLREGDTVRKGQTLGYVGTSGNAPKDTPHLHFAVFQLTPEKHWWEGTPIDPYDILR